MCTWEEKQPRLALHVQGNPREIFVKSVWLTKGGVSPSSWGATVV